MPQNYAGSVYVPEIQTPGYYDEQEQVRQAKQLTLTAAAEQQRNKIAEAKKQQEQQAWLQDAVKRHSVDGKPDYDSVIAEGASKYPDWALEAGKTLEQQRTAMKQARAAELQAEKLAMDNDLEVLKRMTPSSYSVYLPKLSPELQQVMGPTFDPANTPKLIAELAGKGQTEAQRLDELRLLTNENTRLALLKELDSETDPARINEVWSGWEAMYGPKNMAAMRQRVGDVSTPEGKARLQVLIGEAAKDTAKGATSDYSRFLERYAASLGKTADQLTAAEELKAKGQYGRSDDKITVVGGQAGLSPAMESNVLNRITNQWAAAKKPAEELNRQAQLMRVGMEQARKGNLQAGAQTVLVTFQKILDPTSVVRESEYDRSAAGQSLINRVKGAAEQLAKGGAGIPLSELEKFYQLAQEAVKAQTGGYLTSTKERIGRTADRYKIPRDIVFEDLDVTTGSGQQPAAQKMTPPANPKKDQKWDMPNGQTAYWDGTAWVVR